MTAPLLSLSDVRAGSNGSRPTLHGVDLDIHAGEVVQLVGFNGSGKSAVARVIAGMEPTLSGRIEYDGVDITGWSVRARVEQGIVLVPQGGRVFPELSVRRNLQAGGWVRRRDARLADALDAVYAWFPWMRDREDDAAGMLSGGEQQLVAIARSLMAQPRLLVIDEPTRGLSPASSNALDDAIAGLNAAGLTVLLIEQRHKTLAIVDRCVLLEHGRNAGTILLGTDRRVVRPYRQEPARA